MTVGQLNVKLNMELNSLQSQIESANKKIAYMGRRMHSDIAKAARQMNAALATVGVSLSVAGVVAFGKSILDLGGKITDLSKQAGLGTDAFQTLSRVAIESGVSGEQLAQSFVQMRKNVQDAATGAKEQSKALETLQLNAKALQTLAPERQFEMIAQRINGATDKNAAFNAALDILGAKTAPKLTEVLQRLGTEGFDALAAKTKGSILSAEQVKAIDDAGDKLTEIGQKLLALSAKAFVITLEFAKKPNFDQAAGGFEASLKSSLGVFGLLGGQRNMDARARRLIERAGRGEGTDFGIPSIDRQSSLSFSSNQYDAALAAQSRALQMRMRSPRSNTPNAWGAGFEKLENSISSNQRGDGSAYGAWSEILANEQTDWGRYKQDQERMQEMQSELDLFFKDLDEKSEQFKDSAGKLSKAMDGIWENAADNAASAFADMVIDGEASFDKIASSFARMVIEMAAKWAIMRGLESAGLVSSGVGAIAGARAAGGPVASGSTYLVGEEGPELFTPRSSGTIIPNNQLATATTGGGSLTVHINAPGADPAQLRAVVAEVRALNRNFDMRAMSAVSNGKQRGYKV